MAAIDTEPPADLVQLRRDFLAQESRHTELCQVTTPGSEHDDAHETAVREAFNVMAETAATIARHGWWDGAGNRVEAEKVLRAAAG